MVTFFWRISAKSTNFEVPSLGRGIFSEVSVSEVTVSTTSLLISPMSEHICLKLGERRTHTFFSCFWRFRTVLYAADLLKFVCKLFRHRLFVCAVIDVQDNWCYVEIIFKMVKRKGCQFAVFGPRFCKSNFFEHPFGFFRKSKKARHTLAFSGFLSVEKVWLWKNVVWVAYSLRISYERSL